jgi:predicted homoserine dehydrogenase-like protein
MLNSLRNLEARGTRLRIGLAGAGAMGRGVAAAVRRSPGMTLAWVSDLIESRAADAAQLGGAARHGTNTAALLQDFPVDVFVEASTAVIDAAKNAMIAAETGAHIVWMNAEADLAFGPQVYAAAQRHGKIASSDAGDQHGVLSRLLDEVELWGWKVVQAGNIKGFLNEDATPDGMRYEAAKRQLDPRACCAYTDGTKLAIEMAIIANARGLLVPEKGMSGPRAKHVSEALQHFDLAAALATPEVDYLLGAEPGGGVYAIGYMDDPNERFLLDYYKLGAGPFYLHYRPCHLCHVETPLAIATVAIENRALIAPGVRANDVFAVAKCDLPAGTPITHAIGSPQIRGILRRCEANDPRVPIWMIHDTPNCYLRQPVKKGEVLTFDATAIGELPPWA